LMWINKIYKEISVMPKKKKGFVRFP
jgi:hypothetical protein